MLPLILAALIPLAACQQLSVPSEGSFMDLVQYHATRASDSFSVESTPSSAAAPSICIGKTIGIYTDPANANCFYLCYGSAFPGADSNSDLGYQISCCGVGKVYIAASIRYPVGACINIPPPSPPLSPPPPPPRPPPPPPPNLLQSCPNTVLPAPATPVCTVPSDQSLTITFKGSVCTMDLCFSGGSCPCSNYFWGSASCGSLVGGNLNIVMDNSSLPFVANGLQALGINNVQTMFGNLAVSFNFIFEKLTTWSINIFPKLEVITGSFSLSVDTFAKLLLLPGSGLGSLRAAGYINVVNNGGLQNTDLAYLSRVECVGVQFSVQGTANSLTSLKGLERVTDATPFSVPYPDVSNCIFYYTQTPSLLTNVSALATYARCGPNQRPDNSPATNGRPCVQVTCGYLDTWSKLCNYISRRTCT